MKYYLFRSQNFLKISCSNNLNLHLQIHFKPFKLVLDYYQQFQNVINNFQFNNSTCCYAIIGIKWIQSIPFLLIIDQVYAICNLLIDTIFEIKKIVWIPLMKSNQIPIQCQNVINEINKIIQQGYHYYAENYDLNRNFITNKNGFLNYDHQLYYQQFIWNHNIINLDCNKAPIQFQSNKKQFINQCNIMLKWCKCCIEGFIDNFKIYTKQGSILNYYLISRRSNQKVGTRFYARGINDKGFVANFTQTQQIIFLNQKVYTHLQIRGSVPIFFEQLGVQGVTSKLNILRSEKMTTKAFLRHYGNLCIVYHAILCLNLLNKSKQHEQKLTNFFKLMLQSNQYNLPSVHYKYFDFHQQCKNNNFQNTAILINDIKKNILHYSYNCYLIDQKYICKYQIGVVRTNCLDCLDRTNYVQSRIALTILNQIIQDNETNKFANKQYYQQFEQQSNKNGYLLQKFNNIWAQNGDSISYHYTGIGSTHTDITRTGKRTFFGGINHKIRSLMRFYTQFTDIRKHEAINDFQGSKNEIITSINHSITIPYNSFHEISIFSWQFITNNRIEDEKQFYKKLQKLNSTIIIVFLYRKKRNINWYNGIKQIFKNEKYNQNSNSNNEQQQQWQQILNNYLINLCYNGITRIQNESSILLIYAHNNIISQITNINTDEIYLCTKLSLSSISQNSVLIIKFKLFHCPLVFSAFNSTSFVKFKQLLQQIHKYAFQNNQLGKFKSSELMQNHYGIIMGNTSSQNKLNNQRIKIMKNKLIQLKLKNDYKQINRIMNQVYDMDQLIQNFNCKNNNNNNDCLQDYGQAPLNFIPSSNRILFTNHNNLIVKVPEYINISQNCIYGKFNFQVKRNNHCQIRYQK